MTTRGTSYIMEHFEMPFIISHCRLLFFNHNLFLVFKSQPMCGISVLAMLFFFLVINKAISFPILNNKHSICSHCQMVKSHVLPSKNSHIVVSKPLALLYSNVWGLALVLSTTTTRYDISFLYDYTKFL
jgi:hypothetical protein